MPGLDEVRRWISARLPALLAEHQVPAAAVAVAAGDEVVDHAAGVLSTATGVQATVDSVFQVGSITKLWTATLVMQLVDEGRLDLDAPIRDHLPGFRLADDTAAGRISARHLLSHTAGFEGDVVLGTDTGPGDDCLDRLVPTLHGVAQLFPPGELFSYNNAGFSVLGRLVEVLRGRPYDECLREHLIEPLGLTHTAPSPYQAVMYRAAHGHIQTAPGGGFTPAPVWALPRSGSPAGAMLAMRPRDLLGFVRMHLLAARSEDGSAVLSQAGATAMRQRQVEVPRLGGFGNAWGLGWSIYDWPGGTVIGHDGDTIGQAAYLRVVPDRDVAVTLCVNGGNPRPLFEEIFGHVLGELAGVRIPPPAEPVPGVTVAEVTRYLGVYSSSVSESAVSQDGDGRIWLDWTPKGLYAELGGQPERYELVGLDGATGEGGDTLVSVESPNGRHRLFTFVGTGTDGHARFLHTGRADPWTGRH